MPIRRALPTVLISGIVAVNFAVLAPMAHASEAVGCSGSAATFAEDGTPVDAAVVPSDAAGEDDPLELPWTGTLEWEGTTDEVIQDGTWSVDVAPVGAGPLWDYTLGLLLGNFLSGDVENAEGDRTKSGTITPSDLTGTTRMVTGTYEVDWDVSSADASCTGSALIKINDNPFGSVTWWTSIILILIGIIGIILSRPPALPPLAPPTPATPTPPTPPVQNPPNPTPPTPPAQTPQAPPAPPEPPTTGKPLPPPGAPPAQPTPQPQPQPEPSQPANQRPRERHEAIRRGRHPVRGGFMGFILGLGAELMLILYSIPVPLGVAMLGCIVLGILFGLWRRKDDEEQEGATTAPAPA